MSKVKIKEIISFSSEDPAHPASNLLEEAHFRKWKCKEEGEPEACVIFQLGKAVSISCIDIGNECSAMIRELLPAATFMGPIESREMQTSVRNRVRIFGKDQLDKAVMSQKWDIVKVICSQIYNKHVQYGLCFINLLSDTEPKQIPKVTKIGPFSLKPTLKEKSDEPSRIGDLFTKRMEVLSKIGKEEADEKRKTSTSALLRGGPSLAAAAISSSKERVKGLISERPDQVAKTKPGPEEREVSKNVAVTWSNGSSSSSGSDAESARIVENQTNSVKKSLTTSESTRTSVTAPKATEGSSSASPSRTSITYASGVQPKPAASSNSSKTKKMAKPFNRLFEGVTFVISGYENPYRSELRGKGVQMGAKCMADWGQDCTHLICAFRNTPKFRQVKSTGRGCVVSNKWIEDSYRKRRRLPWRRFCMDRNDRGPESEEEVFALDSDDEEGRDEEEMPSQSTASSGVGVTQATRNSMEASKIRDEAQTPKKRRRIMVYDDDSDEEQLEGNDKEQLDPYNVDTDVEEVPSTYLKCKSNDSNDDFFKSSVFCISSDWTSKNESRRKDIERIISKHKGTLSKELTEDVEFLVMVTQQKEWTEEFSEALSENPNLTVVTHEWIAECEKQNEMISPDLFMILPN